MGDKYEITRYKTTAMYCVRPKSGGRPPKELAGTYTKASIAEQAIKAYQKAASRYKPESTPLIELDKLTKKSHLLEFADVMGVDVPEEMTQPASIKKYIKEALEK